MCEFYLQELMGIQRWLPGANKVINNRVSDACEKRYSHVDKSSLESYHLVLKRPSSM